MKDSKIILDEIVPARQPWGARIAGGDVLTIIDLEGQQAVDFLCYDGANPQDRYSATNTVKVQGNIFVGLGSVLYSDSGAALMTVIEDKNYVSNHAFHFYHKHPNSTHDNRPVTPYIIPMSIIPPRPLFDDRPSGLADLDQRSRNIFRRLVDTYLETGEPVGSRTISRILPASLSSASVRNVMMDLEDSGLIYSPHTSAGRVPTEAGLRFFVDALMEVGAVTPDERARIDAEIAASNRPRRLEDVLGEASTLLSGLSHCAGVVMSPKMNARLKHIEFVNLAPGRALVILVGEDGAVENRIIDVPPGLPPSTFTRASNFLSTRFQGKTIAEVQLFMKLEMDTLRRELDEVSAKIVETGIAVWSGESDADSKTLIVRGQANLLENTKAFDDLEKIRKLFEDIENKKELVQLLGAAEGGEGVRIFIGSENKLFSMSGSSLIVAPYKNSDEKIVGVLGIIGPTRMNYARIIPMVDYTAKVVSRLLT